MLCHVHRYPDSCQGQDIQLATHSYSGSSWNDGSLQSSPNYKRLARLIWPIKNPYYPDWLFQVKSYTICIASQQQRQMAIECSGQDDNACDDVCDDKSIECLSVQASEYARSATECRQSHISCLMLLPWQLSKTSRSQICTSSHTQQLAQGAYTRLCVDLHLTSLYQKLQKLCIRQLMQAIMPIEVLTTYLTEQGLPALTFMRWTFHHQSLACTSRSRAMHEMLMSRNSQICDVWTFWSTMQNKRVYRKRSSSSRAASTSCKHCATIGCPRSMPIIQDQGQIVHVNLITVRSIAATSPAR